ncbi:hypothetical protein LCGC14_1757560, partial [marine sediment metagenome]
EAHHLKHVYLSEGDFATEDEKIIAEEIKVADHRSSGSKKSTGKEE